MSGRPAASRKIPVAPLSADGAYALDWQAVHARDLRDIARAIGRDMDLVRTPTEEVVSDWIGAVQWLAAYADRIAGNADKDAAGLRKGGAA